MKVYVVEDKVCVSLKINDEIKEIELKDVKNFEQDCLLFTIAETITKAIVKELDFNEIYKGIQTLINIYWNWQLCTFKNEDISDLSKFRYRYECNIDDNPLKLFFEWKEIVSTKEDFYHEFYHKLYDAVFHSLANAISTEIRKLEFTQLSATIKCACASTNKDIWDNMV